MLILPQAVIILQDILNIILENILLLSRSNKTSVAVLTGKETAEELELLADDVHLYFGLGCRNVTKIFVPEDYDFVPLLNAFKKYNILLIIQIQKQL